MNATLDEFKTLLLRTNSSKLSHVPYLLSTSLPLSSDQISLALQQVHQIRLDSKVFVHANESTLYEVFRIASGTDLLVEPVLDLEKLFWHRRANLRGHLLRVTYAINKPYVYLRNHTLAGANLAVLKLLQKTLNFSLELYEVADKSFGAKDPVTGEWNGVVRDVMDGKADLTCADLSVTKERSTVVDFSVSYYSSVNRIYMRRPLQSLNWLTFIEVFTTWYWVSIFLSGILLVLALMVTTKWIARTNRVHMAFVSVPLALVAYDIRQDPKKVTNRMLIFVICFWGALNFWTYNAGLVSFLTVEIFKPPINSLEDLLKQDNYQIMVVGSTSHEGYFKDTSKAADPVAYQLWNEMIKDNPEAYTANTVAAEKELLNKPTKVYFSQELSVETTFLEFPCKIIASSTTYLRL